MFTAAAEAERQPVRGSRRSVNRTRAGTSTVEFAIIASVLFTLVLGIIEYGRMFMVMEFLTEAARQACRVAIIEGSSSTQIKNTAINFLTTVGVRGETVGVSVNDAPVDSMDPQNMPAYTEMTVIVSVPSSSVSWVPSFLFPSTTLSGQFTMRRE